MKNEDHKLAPGPLNELQRVPYPQGDKPLDCRLVWFLFKLRAELLSPNPNLKGIAKVIETMIDTENKRA